MNMLKKQMRRGFTLVELLVVIAIIAVLAGLATPAILKAKKNADKAQAINNARQIGIALGEFESDYGSYPSDDTREQLEDIDIESPAGEDSNAMLGQLISSGKLDNEEIFFLKAVRGSRKGDNITSSPDEILAKGENSWGYVMLADGEALSSSTASSLTPVLVAPLKEGGTEPAFEGKPYNDKMVYFKADGSVSELPVKKDGSAALKGGRTLFDIGEDTVWEDDQPEVRAPTQLN